MYVYAMLSFPPHGSSILTRITGADKLMEQFEEAAKDIIELDEDEWE